MYKAVIAGYSRSPFTMARKGELIDVKPVNLLADVINNLVIKSNIKTTNLPKIKKEKLLAFCGLANPNKFFDTLKKNGYEISSTRKFPDHYAYKNDDINNLIFDANDLNLKLITTEKDYVKISENKDQIHFLPIELELGVKDKLNFELFLQEKLNA